MSALHQDDADDMEGYRLAALRLTEKVQKDLWPVWGEAVTFMQSWRQPDWVYIPDEAENELREYCKIVALSDAGGNPPIGGPSGLDLGLLCRQQYYTDRYPFLTAFADCWSPPNDINLFTGVLPIVLTVGNERKAFSINQADRVRLLHADMWIALLDLMPPPPPLSTSHVGDVHLHLARTKAMWNFVFRSSGALGIQQSSGRLQARLLRDVLYSRDCIWTWSLNTSTTILKQQYVPDEFYSFAMGREPSLWLKAPSRKQAKVHQWWTETSFARQQYIELHLDADMFPELRSMLSPVGVWERPRSSGSIMWYLLVHTDGWVRYLLQCYLHRISPSKLALVMLIRLLNHLRTLLRPDEGIAIPIPGELLPEEALSTGLASFCRNMRGLLPHGSNRLDEAAWSATMYSKYKSVVSGDLNDEAAAERLSGACRLLGMFFASFDEEAVASCNAKFQAFLMRLLHKAHRLALTYPSLKDRLPDTQQISWQWRQEYAAICGYSDEATMEEADAYIIQLTTRMNAMSTDDNHASEEATATLARGTSDEVNSNNVEQDASPTAFQSDDEVPNGAGSLRRPKRKRASVRRRPKRLETTRRDASIIVNSDAAPTIRSAVPIMKDPRRGLWGILGQPIVLLHWTHLNRKALGLPQYTAAMGQAGWHDIVPEAIGPDKFLRDFVLRIGWVKVRWDDGVVLNVSVRTQKSTASLTQIRLRGAHTDVRHVSCDGPKLSLKALGTYGAFGKMALRA
ncbi:hypothetical protein CALCODRAFT_505468 [Calocera cornea HHB12733]|uniref:Uncharacterized protein n=1 Tax=Calocera cornea HHB12733 TaxID=1353952 RepID=A0A165K5L3_9BASI|nr:hypothetical protein CALCODRAFT_505468 [Calocera cornea HHB12733]